MKNAKSEQEYEAEFCDYLNKTYDGLWDKIDKLLSDNNQSDENWAKYLTSLLEQKNV